VKILLNTIEMEIFIKNSRDEKSIEKRITKEGRPQTVAPQKLRRRKQRNHFLKSKILFWKG